MKTEDILNLEADEHGKRKLNSFLWKIKPLRAKAEKANVTKSVIMPLELIEKAIQGLCSHYGYRTQGIGSYYDSDVFQFYTSSIMNSERKWLGNVYGKTLWEIETKTLIKLYSLILEQKREKQENGK